MSASCSALQRSFTMAISIPDDAPSRRGVVELTRRGTVGFRGTKATIPRTQIAADSCRVEGVRKAKPLPKAFGRGVQVDGVRLGENWTNPY